MLTEDWLTGWATELKAATQRALRDIVSKLPYEPGNHHVGPPTSPTNLTALRERAPWTPNELVALHQWVGPVSLPDIANGLFLHPIDHLIGHVDHYGGVDQISTPFTDNIDVVVFGSNGGGDLYAISTHGSPVFRLRDASYRDRVYNGTEHGIITASQNLPEFLKQLLTAVNAFADDGRTTDL